MCHRGAFQAEVLLLHGASDRLLDHRCWCRCSSLTGDKRGIRLQVTEQVNHSGGPNNFEAIEAFAHGDRESSKVVGRRIDELKLPKGTSIGAIVRGNEVLIAHKDTIVESEDHVILFLTDKRDIREVEKLFQVAITYF